MSYIIRSIFALSLLFVYGCDEPTLHIVTVAEFQRFVKATEYETDAEKYGWSIVQRDVHHFDVLFGIDWRCPTGEYLSVTTDPVTQISYNDAYVYAKWAKVKIPDYANYWRMVARDNRKINSGSTIILPIDQVNIVGNLWEITTPDPIGRIRLAGGSYLCDQSTCNGTDINRHLYVDIETGNSHIGLAVYE